jgi:hypothetical protein
MSLSLGIRRRVRGRLTSLMRSMRGLGARSRVLTPEDDPFLLVGWHAVQRLSSEAFAVENLPNS